MPARYRSCNFELPEDLGQESSHRAWRILCGHHRYRVLHALYQPFAIYRAMFLKDYQIPLIHGEIYNFIKESYTGGSVDVYIPHNLVPGQMKPGDFPARVLRTQSPKDARVAKQISKFRHDEVDATHHEKLYTYECGFSPILGQTRNTFHISFFLIALAFLILDLEILLFFPISVSLSQIGTFGLVIALIFFIVLTIGYVIEILAGNLKVSNHSLSQVAGDRSARSTAAGDYK